MARIVTPTVEVIAPDGTKSLWLVALPHGEAVAAVRKVIPSDHIAELSLIRLPRSQMPVDLRRGEVRKIEDAIHPEPPTDPALIPQSVIEGDQSKPSPTASEYQAFAVASDGKLLGLKEMRCLDDGEAIATAKQLARHCNVEVWNGDRFVVRLVRSN